MAESRGLGCGGGPGRSLRPATPPGVWLPQDGLRGPGAGRAAGADTGAPLGDGPSWDNWHRPVHQNPALGQPACAVPSGT